MLDSLRFVASSVARKDYVPELCHFRIQNGRVTGFNGALAMSALIDIDLNVRPRGGDLLAAIGACEGPIAMHVTAAGRLGVKAGRFRAYIDCLPDEPLHTVEPEGDTIEITPDFMEGIRAVAPIMGIDASRRWSLGIRLQNQSVLATNNVLLVEYWHGCSFPLEVVIPSEAVRELLRIKQDPIKAQLTDNSITFWFEDQRWLRSQLIDPTGWPMNKIEEILGNGTEPVSTIPEGFDEALETLKPFIGEEAAVYLDPEKMKTSMDETAGASVDIELLGVTDAQCYHHRSLLLLTQVADRIDWAAYPRPCVFYKNKRLRGALIGRRV
jgi:hypothetical protein